MSRLMRALLALIAVACAMSSMAHAADKSQQAYWAGFAFTGEQAAVQAATPHTAAALEAHGLGALNQVLNTALKRTPPASLHLIDQAQARLDGSTSAVVLAAALDREMVSIEPIGNQYKVLIEVALQALFFDFREQQVIASYPMTLQRIDVLDRKPGETEVQAAIADLLYGGSATDLPQVLAATLHPVRLPNAAVKRLQVSGVSLSDAFVEKMPESSQADLVRASLALELSKALASNTGVGLLPPNSGAAIGGAMAARFADGKVYQLKIPAPDYVISLDVDAMKSGVVEQTAAMRTLLFGAFYSISVKEPYSGKVFYDQALRKGATKVVPATQQEVDQWSAGYETLLAGLDIFAGSAASRHDARQWLREQKPGGRALDQQTQTLQELIKSCR